MTDFYEWLENVHQPYAPTSPPFTAPTAHPLMPQDRADISMDDITLLDINDEGRMYFDIPPWQTPDVPPEPLPIDPTLVAMINTTPPTPERTFVTVPEHLAETSSKILIYLAQILDVPGTIEDSDEEPAEELAFTTDELEALEPIDEESFKSPTPSIIDGIRVDANPRTREIKTIIDLRRIGPNRQTFYLAKSNKGSYYWLRSPRASRDLQLNKFIGDYRHKSQTGISERTRGIKKLRSGRTIRI
jgi:hypothetical protein